VRVVAGGAVGALLYVKRDLLYVKRDLLHVKIDLLARSWSASASTKGARVEPVPRPTLPQSAESAAMPCGTLGYRRYLISTKGKAGWHSILA
jgi:hypothetical protein